MGDGVEGLTEVQVDMQFSPQPYSTFHHTIKDKFYLSIRRRLLVRNTGLLKFKNKLFG